MVMDFDAFLTYADRKPFIKLFDMLTDAQKKFDKAQDQISVIDMQLRDLDTRYKRAVKHRKNSFRYNLRLKLSVVTGIKMMYNHFASKKAEEIRRFMRQLETIYGSEMRNFDAREPNLRQEPHLDDSLDDEQPSNSMDQNEFQALSPSPHVSGSSSMSSSPASTPPTGQLDPLDQSSAV